MEFYRFIELTVYSLLRIVPYLFFFLYIFKGTFRFSKWIILSSAVLIVLFRCFCGYAGYFHTALLTTANPGILIFVGLCILLIKEHFGQSLFLLLMLSNISNFIVTASKWLERMLFGDIAFLLHRWTNISTLALIEAAVLIPFFFYIKHIYLKSAFQSASKHLWRFLWLVPFTLYAVWYRNSFFTTENPELLSFDHLYMFFCLLVSFGSMLIYTLIVYMINEHAENNRLREKEYFIDLQQTQYESLQERIEEARIARHDLRQHLHVISAYIKDERYEELDAYINSYRQSIPENDTFIFCEHYVINALLQYFSGLAKQYHIKFSAQVNLPGDVGISTDALTVLLGNLLENAIHACQFEKDAAISVRGIVDDNGVFFRIRNTFTGKLQKTADGFYPSTKPAGQGIGLRSVKNIVSNYDGIMDIDYKDSFFIVSVLLNTQK